MIFNKRELLRTLDHLYRLNKDSERGFESVSEHVKNRGLKALLKSQAQRRAEFAAELQSEIHQLQDALPTGGTLLAAIHRGWIDIKAAMTIGRENVERVVLLESERGEAVALRRYQQVLRHELPTTLHQLLQSQAAEVARTHHLVQQIAGRLDDQIVVQLFDNADIARDATALLRDAGIAQEKIQIGEVSQVAQEYFCDCQRSRVMEISFVGMLFGLAFGTILGAIAGSNTVLGPLLVNREAVTMWESVATTTLVGFAGGAGLGGLLGMLIGQATVEDDDYVYHQSMLQGNTLVLVETARARAQAVRQSLHSLHLGARVTAGKTHPDAVSL